MQLKLQKDVCASVEINNEIIINAEESLVYENINSDQAFLYIKDKNENKKIKIHIKKRE